VRSRAAALLGAALILGLVANCDTDAPEVPEGAFYLEARVVVTSGGPDSPARSRDDLGVPTVTDLAWSYRDDRHYRHEYQQPHPFLDWGPRWTATDGEEVVYYDPRAGSYQYFPMRETEFAAYPTFSALIGPMPAADLDAFLELWAEHAEFVEHVGTEEFLGRSVEVIEYGPTWSSSSGSAGSSGGTEQTLEESGGVGRFLVDVEGGFILRHSIDGGQDQQSLAAEVTLLDLAPSFDDDPFQVAVPSEAIEVDGSGSCSSSGTGGPRFAHVPAGWITAGFGSSRVSGCRADEEWSLLTRDEHEVIVLRQSAIPPTGAPAVRADVTPVDIGGVEGYRQTEGDIERLLWIEDGVILLLETNAASFEDLLRIAEAERGQP